MKRKLSIVCSVLFLLTAFSGCASSTDSVKDAPTAPSGESTTTSGEQVTIELFPQKPENVELYKELFAQFMEENPDIVINGTFVPDSQKVIVTRVATNDVPDMVSLLPTSEQFQIMQREGVFRDLSSEPILEKVDPGLVEMCRIDGKVYVVPVNFSGFGLYYNVDLFAEKGLTPPTTIDEMFAICETLKSQGIQPLSIADKDVSNLQQLFERMLAGSVDHDIKATCEQVAAGEISFTDLDNMRRYLEVILKLREYGPEDSLGVDTDMARSEFAQGNTAMIIDGSWLVSVLQTLNPKLNFMVAPFPTISVEETVVVGSPDTAWAISSNSENVEQCMRFMDFFLREDVAQVYADRDMNPSVVKTVNYNIPQLAEINALVTRGKFLVNPSSYWDGALRSEMRTQVQLFLIDKDIDALLTTLDQLISNNYNSKQTA